jgi:hypothetical protein
MTLRDLLAADAAAIFGTGDLSEVVTYYPGGLLYDPRLIGCTVLRNQPSAIPTDEGGFLMVDAVLHIPRGTGAGKLEAVELRRDLVDVVIEDGQPAARCRVTRVVESDPGMWVLEATR